MKHLLLELLKSKKRTEKDIYEFCNQYKTIQNSYCNFEYTNIDSFDNLENAVDNFLDTLTVNAGTDTCDTTLLKSVFIDISKAVEDIEFIDLKNNLNCYTGVSLSKFFDEPEVKEYKFIEILGKYISILEETYKSMKYDERLITKQYYNLKCKLIDTFIWFGGESTG